MPPYQSNLWSGDAETGATHTYFLHQQAISSWAVPAQDVDSRHLGMFMYKWIATITGVPNVSNAYQRQDQISLWIEACNFFDPPRYCLYIA